MEDKKTTIPYFKAGGKDPTVFSASDMNRIVGTVNALANLTVQRGATDAFFFSEANAILQIAKTVASSSGSGNVNYRGEYSSSLDYEPNDLVYVYIDEYERQWWICETANGVAGIHLPGWPEGTPVYWRSITPRGILKYRGLYSSSTEYLPNDVVYLGATPTGRTWWICENENGPGVTVVTPTFAEGSPVYWRAMSGGSGLHYEGVYDSTLAYTAGSVVIIRPGDGSYATWLAIEDCSNTDHPAWPEPSGAKWIMLAQGYVVNLRVCEPDGTITTIPVYGPPP